MLDKVGREHIVTNLLIEASVATKVKMIDKNVENFWPDQHPGWLNWASNEKTSLGLMASHCSWGVIETVLNLESGDLLGNKP